jgi:RNA polymerase sigma-70 factor (ECF subfamily)
MFGTMVKEQRIDALVARAKRGDRSAFQDLVARFRERLLASIRSRRPGREVDPEDILNETILRAFEAIERFTYEDEDSFLRWLFTISRNVQIDAGRRTRAVLSLSAAERVEAPEPSPSRVMRRGERFDRLEQAIEALPSHYREVIRLVRIEGLKTKEAAERLGKSTDAVKHLLARALDLLRTEIGDTESFHLPDRSLGEKGR